MILRTHIYWVIPFHTSQLLREGVLLLEIKDYKKKHRRGVRSDCPLLNIFLVLIKRLKMERQNDTSWKKSSPSGNVNSLLSCLNICFKFPKSAFLGLAWQWDSSERAQSPRLQKLRQHEAEPPPLQEPRQPGLERIRLSRYSEACQRVLWGLASLCLWKEEAFCGECGTRWTLLVLAFQQGVKPLAKHSLLFLRKEVYKAQKTLDIK